MRRGAAHAVCRQRGSSTDPSSDRIALGGTINHARGTDEAGVRVTTADKSSLFGQYDRDFAPRWFGFVRLAYDRDALIDLSARTALTGGVGHRLIDAPEHTFTLLGRRSVRQRTT